jgi:hypothetical protein
MSRRCHHGSPRHVPLGRIPRRPAAPTPERPAPAATHQAPAPVRGFEQIEEGHELEASQPPAADAPSVRVEQVDVPRPAVPAPIEADDAREFVGDATGSVGPAPRVVAPRPSAPPPSAPPPSAPPAGAPWPRAPRPAESRQPAPLIARPESPRAHVEREDTAIERTATAPQLRRFIKSRAYVPMHELRRRFVINGGDDEVTPVDLERKRVFVGLPEREGRLLGELLRAGDIGYELSLDPISPIVVGVYPMRPVTRV